MRGGGEEEKDSDPSATALNPLASCVKERKNGWRHAVPAALLIIQSKRAVGFPYPPLPDLSEFS